MAAHFGQMLLDRRRQMGMSIQQVANTIKIRPQIIEFFETEDFAAMPPRGYAQGMISSYARYLGLNPREVVEAYFDGLYAYENAQGGSEPSRYREMDPQPSLRSSNASGRYLMVDSVPASRYAQRPPQAGYVPESRSPHEPVAASQLRPMNVHPAGRPQRYLGASGVPRGYSTPAQQTRGAARGFGGAGAQETTRFPAQRGDAAPMRRTPQRTRGGYRNGGGGNVPPSRSRRQGRGPAGNARGRGSMLSTLDPRLLIGAAVAALAVVVLAVFLLMRGCAPKPKTDADATTPAVAPATGSSSRDADGADSDATGTDANETDGAGDGDAKDDASEAAAKEPEETKVKVSIDTKGAVAWIEVKLDSKSVLAEEQVGPFEQEYTVEQSIDITTDKPSDVTVTKNGEKVRYDTKISGVAKVSITVPKKTDDGNDKNGDKKDSSDSASGDAGAQDGSASDETAN